MPTAKQDLDTRTSYPCSNNAEVDQLPRTKTSPECRDLKAANSIIKSKMRHFSQLKTPRAASTINLGTLSCTRAQNHLLICRSRSRRGITMAIRTTSSSPLENLMSRRRQKILASPYQAKVKLETSSRHPTRAYHRFINKTSSSRIVTRPEACTNSRTLITSR